MKRIYTGGFGCIGRPDEAVVMMAVDDFSIPDDLREMALSLGRDPAVEWLDFTTNGAPFDRDAAFRAWCSAGLHLRLSYPAA